MVARDEVVGIEELRVVGEDDVVPRRCADILFNPLLDVGHEGMVVGGSRSDKVDSVVLEEELVGLMQAGERFAIVVGKAVAVDKDHGARAVGLTVVDPADDGHEIMEDNLVVKAVLAMEADGLRIVLAEHVEGVDDGVGIAEETVDAALLGGIDMAEAVGGNLLILLLCRAFVTMTSCTPSWRGF